MQQQQAKTTNPYISFSFIIENEPKRPKREYFKIDTTIKQEKEKQIVSQQHVPQVTQQQEVPTLPHVPQQPHQEREIAVSIASSSPSSSSSSPSPSSSPPPLPVITPGMNALNRSFATPKGKNKIICTLLIIYQVKMNCLTKT